jgi:hypothetical protein
MALENILISQRAISSEYKEGEFFKYLPKIFRYLLSKHEDDGFAGCDSIRLAVTDSFDRDTRTLLSDESVVIFDLSFAHGCDEIIKAFSALDSTDLCTFNDFIFDLIEKHLHDNAEYHHALWLHMCKSSLFFDYKHQHRLKHSQLPAISKPEDRDLVEIKLQAIILAHEIRHHLITKSARANRINGMLRTWIEIVQFESFDELGENDFNAVLEHSVEELICDYAAISYVDDFDWDLRMNSKTPKRDFGVAMFSLALFFDILAHLKYKKSDLEHTSLRLRSAVLRRSSHAVVGAEDRELLSIKYEALHSHAIKLIDGVLGIRNCTPPSEITDFSRPDLALEYFNAYDREESDEWDAFVNSDLDTWYGKVAAYFQASSDMEFGLIDFICKRAMSESWLAPTIDLLYEKLNPEMH